MNKCGCINSKTGRPKEVYADNAQALVACAESKKKYPDSDALNVYHCDEGECYHVGNSWEHVGKKKRPRPIPVRDQNLVLPPPDFEPPPEWFHETVQDPVLPLKVRLSLDKVATRPIAAQIAAPPQRAVQVQSPASPGFSAADVHPDKTKEAVSWVKEAAGAGLGLSIIAAELIAAETGKIARQVLPVVERSTDTLLKWAMNGLKASADYLSEMHKKLEQKAKK